MSLSYIMARMQLLSGTTEDWTTGDKKDFVIMPNELAVEWKEESNGYYSGFIGIKIGDGQNTFENLSYVTNLDTTTVLVGGNPVQTFNADTKVSSLTTTDLALRVYTRYGTTNGSAFIASTASMLTQAASGTRLAMYDMNGRDDEDIVYKHLMTGDPQYKYDATNKKYVDEQITVMGDTKVNIASGNQELGVVPYFGPRLATQTWLNVGESVHSAKSGALARYITTTSTNADTIPSGCLITNTPTKIAHAANKKYVDDNFIAKSGDGTIDGSLTVAGDLIVQGTTHTQDTETLRIVDNIIEINSEKADNATVLSGVAINKNSDSTYGVMYDPTDDTVKFGEGQTKDGEFSFKNGEGAPLAIREDSSNIADGAIMIFDKSKNKLVDSGYTIDGFKQWVKDYIELYMSTTIVENEAGGETLDINTDNYTEDNGTLTIGG